jgi:HAD superfamily hydrolase (TIGR01484 family)
MDETLTYQGRLAAETYSALERLQAAGVKVIPVTAAPAGWCDQMARMWPVDGVIGENGGFFFRRRNDGHGVERFFWHGDLHTEMGQRLERIGEEVRGVLPAAVYADDQPFRLMSLAFKRPKTLDTQEIILSALRNAGAEATVNNLWVLGWLGKYDKLAMARRVLLDIYGLDTAADNAAVLYTGDSINDAPMFEFFQNTVGVSTIAESLDHISTPPRWLTRGPGGVGFVETANVVIAALSANSFAKRSA